MKIGYLVSAVAGAVVGAAASFYITKKVVEKEAQMELDKQMKAFFKIREEQENAEQTEKDIPQSTGDTGENRSGDPGVSVSPDNAPDQNNNRNDKDFSDTYRKIIKSHSYQGGDYYDYNHSESERHDLMEDLGRIPLSPVLISDEEFEHKSAGYERCWCDYYADGVLTIDGQEVVIDGDEFESYFGDCLDEVRSGETVYIRNDVKKRYYEVTISDQKFEDLL